MKYLWAAAVVTSLSKGFSNNELGGLSLWELPPISDTSDASVSFAGGAVPVLTVDELESVQRQAYDEAAKTGHEQGYTEGFEQGKIDGYKVGIAQGDADLKQRIHDVGALLDIMAQPLRELDAQVEEELVVLATAIAQQVVRRELKIDPGQVISVVREALGILPVSSRNVRLFLHPDDADLVRSVFDVADDAPTWTLVEDPLLSRGGCKVESESSRIDATVEKQLAAVIATVLGGERDRDSVS